MAVKIFGPPGASSGSGSVGGPASATDNALTRFDGTTGKLVQNSNATLDDAGNLVVSGTIDAGFAGVIANVDNEAVDTVDLSVASSANLNEALTTLGRVIHGSESTGVSIAAKYTVTAAQIAGLGGGTTGSLALFTLPANGAITGIRMKTTAQIAGSTGLSASIGDETSGLVDYYASAFGLDTEEAPANMQNTDLFKSSTTDAVEIRAYFESDDPLSGATGGSLNVWVSYVVLPA